MAMTQAEAMANEQTAPAQSLTMVLLIIDDSVGETTALICSPTLRETTEYMYGQRDH